MPLHARQTADFCWRLNGPLTEIIIQIASWHHSEGLWLAFEHQSDVSRFCLDCTAVSQLIPLRYPMRMIWL